MRAITLTYVDKLQRANALEVAFFPLEALRRAMEAGQIIEAEENGDPAGYLWHGVLRAGRDAVIYQACIDYDARRRSLGFGMVRQLIDLAAAARCTGIVLRCASAADANEFWRAIGFYCTRVTAGGRSRARDINHWRTDIAPGFWRLETDASSRPMDRSSYYALLRRDGTSGLLSRFAHPTRVALDRVGRADEDAV